MWLFSILLCSRQATSQTVGIPEILGNPTTYLTGVIDKSSKLQNKLDRYTNKILDRWQKLEDKVIRKLGHSDSLQSRTLTEISRTQREKLSTKLIRSPNRRHYNPILDSLQTSIKYLSSLAVDNDNSLGLNKRLKAATGSLSKLEDRLHAAGAVKQYLIERRANLKSSIGKFGFSKELKMLNKKANQYNQQIIQVTSILKDHNKLEANALKILNDSKAYQKFMRKHSLLASMFRLPEDESLTELKNFKGLQKRTDLNKSIQDKIATGGDGGLSHFQSNFHVAQQQLNLLKSRLSRGAILYGTNDDLSLTRPNTKASLPFLKRLEYKTDFQSRPGNFYLPTHMDIALLAGYKLNDVSVIGIGVNYKVGLGSDIKHLNFTNQGVGIRSYLDYNIKGMFYATGAYEFNHLRMFRRFDELKGLSAWQRSGLIGISKKYQVSNQVKGEMKILWDLLSYSQIPRTQAIQFRVGYIFNKL